MFQFAQQRDVFQPAETLLDPFPSLLTHGIACVPRGVAHPLRLDYVGLKRRLEGVSKFKEKTKVASPGFVELIPAEPAAAECVIEFESKSGGKMRIQWKGSGAPDWSSLLRAWREAER